MDATEPLGANGGASEMDQVRKDAEFLCAIRVMPQMLPDPSDVFLAYVRPPPERFKGWCRKLGMIFRHVISSTLINTKQYPTLFM